MAWRHRSSAVTPLLPEIFWRLAAHRLASHWLGANACPGAPCSKPHRDGKPRIA